MVGTRSGSRRQAINPDNPRPSRTKTRKQVLRIEQRQDARNRRRRQIQQRERQAKKQLIQAGVQSSKAEQIAKQTQGQIDQVRPLVQQAKNTKGIDLDVKQEGKQITFKTDVELTPAQKSARRFNKSIKKQRKQIKQERQQLKKARRKARQAKEGEFVTFPTGAGGFHKRPAKQFFKQRVQIEQRDLAKAKQHLRTIRQQKRESVAARLPRFDEPAETAGEGTDPDDRRQPVPEQGETIAKERVTVQDAQGDVEVVTRARDVRTGKTITTDNPAVVERFEQGETVGQQLRRKGLNPAEISAELESRQTSLPRRGTQARQTIENIQQGQTGDPIQTAARALARGDTTNFLLSRGANPRFIRQQNRQLISNNRRRRRRRSPGEQNAREVVDTTTRTTDMVRSNKLSGILFRGDGKAGRGGDSVRVGRDRADSRKVAVQQGTLGILAQVPREVGRVIGGTVSSVAEGAVRTSLSLERARNRLLGIERDKPPQKTIGFDGETIRPVPLSKLPSDPDVQNFALTAGSVGLFAAGTVGQGIVQTAGAIDAGIQSQQAVRKPTPRNIAEAVVAAGFSAEDFRVGTGLRRGIGRVNDGVRVETQRARTERITNPDTGEVAETGNVRVRALTEEGENVIVAGDVAQQSKPIPDTPGQRVQGSEFRGRASIVRPRGDDVRTIAERDVEASGAGVSREDEGFTEFVEIREEGGRVDEQIVEGVTEQRPPGPDVERRQQITFTSDVGEDITQPRGQPRQLGAAGERVSAEVRDDNARVQNVEVSAVEVGGRRGLDEARRRFTPSTDQRRANLQQLQDEGAPTTGQVRQGQELRGVDEEAAPVTEAQAIAENIARSRASQGGDVIAGIRSTTQEDTTQAVQEQDQGETTGQQQDTTPTQQQQTQFTTPEIVQQTRQQAQEQQRSGEVFEQRNERRRRRRQRNQVGINTEQGQQSIQGLQPLIDLAPVTVLNAGTRSGQREAARQDTAQEQRFAQEQARKPRLDIPNRPNTRPNISSPNPPNIPRKPNIPPQFGLELPGETEQDTQREGEQRPDFAPDLAALSLEQRGPQKKTDTFTGFAPRLIPEDEEAFPDVGESLIGGLSR